MRRRPVAVYRVIDEAELLGEVAAEPGAGPPPGPRMLGLDNDRSDPAACAPLLGRPGVRLACTGIGALALVAATLFALAPARHAALPPRSLAASVLRTPKLVRLAVRAQTPTGSARRPTSLQGSWPQARAGRPTQGASRRDARAKRPPRGGRVPVRSAPPAAAPAPGAASAGGAAGGLRGIAGESTARSAPGGSPGTARASTGGAPPAQGGRPSPAGEFGFER
jgi:hypothetical protein